MGRIWSLDFYEVLYMWISVAALARHMLVVMTLLALQGDGMTPLGCNKARRDWSNTTKLLRWLLKGCRAVAK